MHDNERDRIFGEWLAGHKGILFKVVHAYAFEHADRQDLFQEVAVQVWRSVDAFRGESSVPTWMYRVALESILGFTLRGDWFTVDPTIPRAWPGFALTYRRASTSYEISVENPNGISRGVHRIELDGAELTDRRVPIVEDGRLHRVRVVLC